MGHQLAELLKRLSWRQKVLIGAAAIAVIASLAALTRWRRESDFKPLFTQMAAEDAAAVIEKLRETGTEYRVSENGAAVLVPSGKVAELRLQLAGAGLPRTGRAGFELFDKTNFGVTDFAEHINFRRALEGELERSVMALSEVQQARVHITFPKDSVFLEQRQPAKASVMLKLRPAARLSQANVTAVAHLVASAVEGLAPDAVSVLDMQGNLLSRPRRVPLDGTEPSEATLEFKQQIEKDLLAKINSTLEPLLGYEKFRAGVSVECDFTSGEQSEEVFDPSRSVMTSSQKTEDATGTSIAAGVPGTASSLPRPASRPASSGGGISRKTENIVFQSSRLVKHTRLPQGTVKRMSVSVLLDHTLKWQGTRRILEAPSPERLNAIRELVAGSIGLNAERGDQLIIESLPFESTLTAEPPAPGVKPQPAPPLGLDWQRIPANMLAIGGAAAGVLLLAVGGFAVLLAKRRRRKRAAVAMRQALPPGAAAARATELNDAGTEGGHDLEGRLAAQKALREKMQADALETLKLPPVATKKAEVLTKHLVESAKSDPTGAAQVLRTWLADNDR